MTVPQERRSQTVPNVSRHQFQIGLGYQSQHDFADELITLNQQPELSAGYFLQFSELFQSHLGRGILFICRIASPRRLHSARPRFLFSHMRGSTFGQELADNLSGLHWIVPKLRLTASVYQHRLVTVGFRRCE